MWGFPLLRLVLPGKLCFLGMGWGNEREREKVGKVGEGKGE